QKWLKQLKSIKLSRSKVGFIRGKHRHNEAARSIAPPRVGFGLASELRRAGVFVKIVKIGDKVNAADSSLKREMMSGG
ncbi:C2H2 zinc finger protein, partial [Trifolium medium]|nr:C2H2 zinc finger protein [Trifolium medium]